MSSSEPPQPTALEPPAPSEDGTAARNAGRGGLAIAFAKLYFMAQGLLQQVLLPRVLGLDGYGALSSVLSVGSIAYNPVVSTSIQGVSHAVSQAPEQEQLAAQRKALVIHGALALPVAAAFLVLAGPLGQAMGAPHLVPGLRLMSAVLLLYGLYAPLVGALNGRRRFVHQAGLDIVMATLRTGGLVGGAWLAGSHGGRAVTGSVGGFVASALTILVLALLLAGLGRRGTGGPSVARHLGFLWPLALGWVLLNLLLQADLTLLRVFCASAAREAGLAPEAADPLVGAYRATQLFCFLPYQLLLAITFILFPMLSRAHAGRDGAAVARYVSTGVRLALVLAGGMVSVTSGLAKGLLLLVFPPQAAELGAHSMQVLSLGFGAFAVFGILTTVLNSLDRERASAAVTSLAVALVGALCWLRVPGTSFGEELLWQTATSTVAGIGLATGLAGWLVWRSAGAVVAPLTLVRVLLAMAAAIGVGRALPLGSKGLTVVESGAVALVYAAGLLALRELDRRDLGMLRTVLRRPA